MSTTMQYQRPSYSKPYVPPMYSATVMVCPSTTMGVCTSPSWLPIVPRSVHITAHAGTESFQPFAGPCEQQPDEPGPQTLFVHTLLKTPVFHHPAATHLTLGTPAVEG